MKINLNKSDYYIIGLFYLISIPVTLLDYEYDEGYLEPIMGTLVYVVFTFIVAYVIVLKLFPYFFPRKKIALLFFWTVLFLAFIGLMEIIAYQVVDGQGMAFIKQYWNNGIIWVWGIMTSSQNAGILIGILLGKKFYDAQLDIAARDKEKKENELRLLKAQIDPHFLFNNLNTVDSLIDRDPKVAKEYLQRLSQLYRYLIRTKDDEVVLLKEELDFAKNYIFLLQKRFGKTYEFEIEGEHLIEDQLIPPGALQTLLENVVKHNAAEANEHILTDIIIDQDQIVVSNNIKMKGNRSSSNNTGLKNLKARYALLSDLEIRIEENSSFTVVLPHIKEVE